jgi:threonine/homoserine/homoserine lactone efflux protein
VNELAALGLGLALGIVTGMPLGVVNVAIVDAATQGRARFAVGIGIGGGIADAIHSSIAFAGVGSLAASYSKPLAVGAGIVIIAYALIARRFTRHAHGKHGVVTGLLFTLPNPAALAAWVAIASATWPTISMADAIVVGAGVGIGSAAWFATLAHFARRWRPTWLPTVAAVLLAGIAGYGIVRAFL